MLHIRKPATDVFAPIVHVIFERRASDAYQLEESALAATPFLESELQLVTIEPLLESEMRSVEQMESGPANELEAVAALEELTRVKFRQALLDVDDPEAFWAGVVGGQITIVEEEQPLTGAQLFALFEDAVHDVEFSETWLAGYLLGLSDALLRKRKIYPRVYAAQLKSLKKLEMQ